MNRILEYSPAPEEAVVSRILVMVHKAVDQNFPDAQKANRQFTKTVFSDEESESTAINKLPTPSSPSEHVAALESQFAEEIDTGEIPRPQTQHERASRESPSQDSPEYNSILDPMRGHLESEPASKILTREGRFPKKSPDWVARALGALIIAGLILLVSLLLAQP